MPSNCDARAGGCARATRATMLGESVGANHGSNPLQLYRALQTKNMPGERVQVECHNANGFWSSGPQCDVKPLYLEPGMCDGKPNTTRFS